MAKEVGFGIIGAGLVGPTHALSASRAPNGRLVAICDMNGERAKALADQYRVPWYTDAQEMLAKEPGIQVVNLCVPTAHHLPLAQLAAQAGKHVIVEKPIELNMERANQLIEVCRRNNVKLGAIYNRRFVPALRKAKEAMEKGWLGKPIFASMYYKSYRSQEYYDDSGWRGSMALEGGAALINQGIHGIDLVQWVFGPVAELFSYVATLRRKIEGDDTSITAVKFQSGALGSFEETTSVYPAQKDRLEFHGENGTIRIEDYRIIDWSIESHPLDPAEVADPPDLPRGSIVAWGHMQQIADMATAVKEDRRPAVVGEDALPALEIIMGIYQSAKTGKPVSLPLAPVPIPPAS